MAIDLWTEGGVMDTVQSTALELGWEEGDEIIIKIAGTRTSGIHQTEGANARWSPPFGDVRHNTDAQIVIENLSRRDLTKSEPIQQDELLAKFHYGDDGQLYKTRELEELPEPQGVDAPRASAGAEASHGGGETLSTGKGLPRRYGSLDSWDDIDLAPGLTD